MKLLLLIMVGVLILIGVCVVVLWPLSLDKIHTKIINDFHDVEHLSLEQYERLNPAEIVLFDVREVNEFDVSHIPGAIQVSPQISDTEFYDRYAELINGKSVIFYCSVGRRSSELVSRLNLLSSGHGVPSAKNLSGGIFNWVNHNKSLAQNQEITNKVHPYNLFWGRLISDSSKVSYAPDLKKD